MREKLLEAVDLFEEVMIFGTEHVIKNMDIPIWKEYSPEQIQVLKILSTYGALSSGKLATIQGVHKSAVSSRLKKLEEKGLVTSERDENDQRAKIIRLTSEGIEVLQTSNNAVYENIEKLFKDRIDEKELETFVETFRKLKEILQMKEM
ncbi:MULTISPECIES: MarR family winged helix-turn-helix transcriptional regulator [Sporosarcina]|uniref:MarR family winged helix-turn-helix transcriptional regulator n=1 Tax=Sporosarcina TaxID=1569 RepID=UPI00078BDECE|nr:MULTISPECIES: MarR family transcriptional regulator [Sporosarcina]AMQ04793.1 MarR family transcriptional regulator [Sporosarcina psychrophila]QNK88515.1 MarR family transcriptional regulator [Sporosarcina sp. resist]